MTQERRWMKPMLAEAMVCRTKMPWERGLRRQAMISRREAAAAALRAAARATAILQPMRQTG